MSLDFDNIVVKVDNRIVNVGTSEVPIMVLPQSWDSISGKPDTFPPEPHTHDDRYYTETEIDSLLDDKQDALTFDDEPTENSDNPVTSDGIKTALDGKQDALTFDDTPTTGSGNPVTSSGIKSVVDGKAEAITSTVSGSLVAFDDGAPVPVVDLTVGIEPIQSGTGDPSPENVRPITGWTGLKLWQAGKNFLPNKRYVSSTRVIFGQEVSYNSARKIFLKPGIYTIHVTWESSEYISSIYYASTTIPTTRISVTDTALITITEADYFAFWVYNGNGVNNDKLISFQLEKAAVATDYEPYNGTEIAIEFGTTVYGAWLNATTGLLTVTHEIVDLGTLSWTRNTSGSNPYFRASLASTKRYAIYDQPGCYADRYKLIAAVNGSTFASNANNNECTILSNSAILAIRNDSYTTADDFTTAMNGAQFVYELAEPVTYQLTPAEVLTILGQNNIWADTGDTTVTYRADTKLYIDDAVDESGAITQNMIAQSSETEMVASKNYAVGDLLIVNNQLLRATAVISSGGIITIGTSGNAEVIDLATVITELSARISALEQ